MTFLSRTVSELAQLIVQIFDIAFLSLFELIGKRVLDLLVVLIELFSLGLTAEALRAIIGSKSAISLQRGPVDPKFQVEGDVPRQSFFTQIGQ